MTLQEIKELKEMGFSTDQIMSLSGVQATAPVSAPDQEEPEAEETEPAENQASAPAETPDPDPRLSELENAVKAQSQQIEQLTKQLQAENRQNMSLDRPPDDLDKKVDAVMAELIRPTIKNKEGTT